MIIIVVLQKAKYKFRPVVVLLYSTKNSTVNYFGVLNPLTTELNTPAQRWLPRFFTGDLNF
jgi:hypothetical protein